MSSALKSRMNFIRKSEILLRVNGARNLSHSRTAKLRKRLMLKPSQSGVILEEILSRRDEPHVDLQWAGDGI
ncbi:hypothetical protein KIN20_006862 [Parelaphostrongylus tenuis]|uniref:Uncharacterized protein n=1 Tax=Parelaphostrongylus tenuis TaxID=148309 RepID=A0AAD5QLD3_PARTN|nr:hypothetical protein KIN20_006862 [Parelaphostrongylus tenuis]